MAIPSIWRLISYSSNTKFLLVNFAIVKKKKNYIKGASIGGRLGSLKILDHYFTV